VRTTRASLPLALALVATAGCHPQTPAHPTNVQIPVPDTQRDQGLEPAREAPPESGPPRETPFPKIEHQDLANGLGLDVVVSVGQRVAAGDPLVVLEAMKMETVATADTAGVVTRVHVAAGAMVEPGQLLVKLEPS